MSVCVRDTLTKNLERMRSLFALPNVNCRSGGNHMQDGRTRATGPMQPPSRHDPESMEIITPLRLSRREAEMIECMLRLCDDEISIAEALSMSRHTVHTHLERLYRKLHVNNRCQLVVRVLLVYSNLVRAKAEHAIGASRDMGITDPGFLRPPSSRRTKSRLVIDSGGS